MGGKPSRRLVGVGATLFATLFATVLVIVAVSAAWGGRQVPHPLASGELVPESLPGSVDALPEQPTPEVALEPAIAEEVAATAPEVMPEPSAPVVEPPPPALDAATERRLAWEIAQRKGRDSEQLVSAVRGGFEDRRPAIPLTFLLSIAYNETHGKVLAVSPSGAVGLAQATPAAYLAEPGFDGKLFITNQYLIGARTYIMKKPLGDAVAIANSLVWKNDTPMRLRARTLLDAAYELQREGMDELQALEPHAPPLFAERIREADEYNARALAELERLIDRRATKAELTGYRDRVRKEFSSRMRLQQGAWEAYQNDLERERDRLLRARYGTSPNDVIRGRAYEAGEYLAETLDVRFSPTHMASFLAAHLETKQRQARDELGIADHELEEWTAALYNGGAVNVKRMRAGLMGSLRETQLYMRKIPALRADLDRAIGAA